ncbi:MAG: DUF4265 domain-containing protein [Chitinophagales bacterium]|nr:DUF4265 domain-containing protein [Chitinophagales bacterium]
MSDFEKIKVIREGSSEIIFGKRIAENIYRCEESALFIEELVYGAEIEVKEENGQKVMVKLINASPFITTRILLSREMLDSDKGKEAKSKIISYGGEWEQIMGGYFLFHLPKDRKREIIEIKSLLKAE